MAEKTTTIVQAVIIITSIFTLVAIFVISYFVYFNKRKAKLIEDNFKMKELFHEQLLMSQIEVQEQTFEHIAKELHDNVGQLLSSAKLLLGLTEMGLTDPPNNLINANNTLGQAINELRTLSKSLDREWLEQFNFTENLKNEITRINSSAKVKVVYSQGVNISLEPGEQIILFRIVQEAVQNAIKHAKPKNIEIKSSFEDNVFYIRIIDDGIGFEITNFTKGLGINNIKHRTSLLKGVVTWNSNIGKGTTVTITIP